MAAKRKRKPAPEPPPKPRRTVVTLDVPSRAPAVVQSFAHRLERPVAEVVRALLAWAIDNEEAVRQMILYGKTLDEVCDELELATSEGEPRPPTTPERTTNG